MRMKRCQCWIGKYKHRRANKLRIQLEEDKFYILLLLTQINGQLHSVNVMNSVNIPQISKWYRRVLLSYQYQLTSDSLNF
jgi:hypothetical protein